MTLLIHSQMLTVAPLRFRYGYAISSQLNRYTYLSIPGLKLNHVSKRGPWWHACASVTSNINSGYGLLPANYQALTWALTNFDFMSIGTVNNIPITLIRKSKDYVYGKWVYKVLGIWKGYHKVKNPLVSYMKPWTEARNNDKYMKYHSKLTYQLSF